jgi:hypothetical protein
MSDPPGTERPYRIDEAWSRAVHARRTGAVAAFLAPHLRGGMRLIDCGCVPARSPSISPKRWRQAERLVSTSARTP